ncbi:MAG: Mur ligase domain-containing protein, partial [Xanthomonadales bacterium]|nr:Mur ligase domain-containing protein [Xanthomonadales bacterium]
MMPLALSDLARLLGCDCDAAGMEIRDVVTDSRKVTPGCLFAALVGERVDGHDFAGRAVASGA